MCNHTHNKSATIRGGQNGLNRPNGLTEEFNAKLAVNDKKKSFSVCREDRELIFGYQISCVSVSLKTTKPEQEKVFT